MDMGMVPTPVNYFCNYNEFGGVFASASVMITGSHNPSEYNGFKDYHRQRRFLGEQIYALGRECEAMTGVPEATRDVTNRRNFSLY